MNESLQGRYVKIRTNDKKPSPSSGPLWVYGELVSCVTGNVVATTIGYTHRLAAAGAAEELAKALGCTVEG